MTIEQIKENLYSAKVNDILNSEMEYLYRNTCEFIIDQYKLFEEKITDQDALSHLLPLAYLSDFFIQPSDAGSKTLREKIDKTFGDQSSKSDNLKLIDFLVEEEKSLLALILFKHTKLDWQSIQDKVKLFTIEQQEEIFEKYFDQPLKQKELSHFQYTFELNLTYLQYQQLLQSSYTTLINQDLSMANGYHTPQAIIDAGLQGEYIMVMKRALNTFNEINQSFPQLSKYMIPLAFLQKVLFTVNIIQLSHLQNALAEQLWAEVKRVHPTVYQGAKSLLCNTKN